MERRRPRLLGQLGGVAPRDHAGDGPRCARAKAGDVPRVRALRLAAVSNTY